MIQKFNEYNLNEADYTEDALEFCEQDYEIITELLDNLKSAVYLG